MNAIRKIFYADAKAFLLTGNLFAYTLLSSFLNLKKMCT